MLPVSFNRDWTCCEISGNAGPDPRATRGGRVRVTLPHDATIHEKRSADAPGGGAKGYYPSRDYEYVKTFQVPADWAQKRVWLRFEGAYMNARVFVNGDYAGGRANGYAEFSVPLHDHLRFGGENEVRVTVQSDEDSRWYAGAGLYRNVSLFTADPLRIDMDGFRLTTLSADEAVAAVRADLTVVNDGVRARSVRVEIELLDAQGRVACRDVQPLNLTGLTREAVHPRLYVERPRLWSPEAPNLYRAVARLIEGEATVDEAAVETFGIRVLTLDSVHGLAINARPVKLYGGCIHHDNGVIGAATLERAEERRARLMKAAGYNALRSAHHPMSRAMLAACDRLGLLVMDELTDMWNVSKTRRDFGRSFAVEWEDDLRSMVAKDYNHPCVVMYSMGNEIPESGTPAGAAIYRRLAERTRALDGTRYITAGQNNMLADAELERIFGAEEGGLDALLSSDLGDRMTRIALHPAVVAATLESYESLDVCGYNYSADRYLHDFRQFTNRISVGTETFPKDLAYNWSIVTGNPHVLGDFVWTAWDYLGEAALGADHYRAGDGGDFGRRGYPWRISWDADFDITGRRTPQGYYREIVVGHREAPYVAMQDPRTYDLEPVAAAWSWPGTVSSWNWPGWEGKPIRIDVYGRGDEAELIVNGESLGRKPLPRRSEGPALAFLASFDAVYRPGRVEAVVYTGGIETGRCVVLSADEPTQARVELDREKLTDGDGELAFVDVWLLDGEGRLNSGAERTVAITVEGDGVLQGIGSGNPCTDEDFFDDHCRTFFGHAFAAIRPTGAGEITVTVRCEGLGQTVRRIEVVPAGDAERR